jgi:hypothetical protein
MHNLNHHFAQYIITGLFFCRFFCCLIVCFSTNAFIYWFLLNFLTHPSYDILPAQSSTFKFLNFLLYLYKLRLFGYHFGNNVLVYIWGKFQNNHFSLVKCPIIDKGARLHGYKNMLY